MRFPHLGQPPQGQEVLLDGAVHPCGDTPSKNTLSGSDVKVPEHLERDLRVSQVFEVQKMLSSFYHQGVDD